jgi:molybdopterin/thiamine biosynthesis adenylyltransferase
MNKKTQVGMNEEIQKRSRTIKDLTGRDVRILEDHTALKIAGGRHCTVREVYTEALRLGIFPYRYLRNRQAISNEEQLKLAESQVTVVGAGGLGGQVILLLGRIGIGCLVVVDQDVFDETNLNRQALSSRNVLGRSKSETAVSVINDINPGVDVMSYRIKIDPANVLDTMAGSDVVVDALDNIPDRFILERGAKKMGIPLVHGAVAGLNGQIMTIFPNDVGLENLYGTGTIRKAAAASPESVLGVPTLTPAMIATLQAMEVLKIILNRGKTFRNKMVYIDMETGQMNQFSLKNYS